MGTQPGTLELLARELGLALAALEQKVKADSPENFIAELGLRPPPTMVADAQFVSAVVAVATAATGLPTPVEALIAAIEASDVGAIISTAEQVLSAITNVLSAISSLGNALNTLASSVAGLTPAQVAQIQAFAQAFPRRLFDFTMIEYLASKGSTVVPTLCLTGLIEDTLLPGDPTNPMSPPLRSRVLHFERLGDLFSSPGNFLSSAFQWGSPSFDGTVIFSLLQTFLQAFDLPSNILTAAGQSPVFEAYVLRLSADSTTNPPGLTASLRVPAIQDFSQTYQLSALWALTVSVSARFAAGIQASIQPPAQLSLTPPSGTISLQSSAGIAAQHADGSPVVLLGQTGGSVLQTQSISGSFGFNGSWDSGSGTAKGEPTVGANIAGGKLVIDMSQADGFLADVIGDAPIQATFDIAATWAPDTGLHITGGAQLEIDLPLHLDLGPVTMPELYLIGGLANGAITLEISAALGITLGPIQGSVDRVGLLGTLTFPQSGGNLGPANLKLGFKPPNGLGLAIDAGLVTGGGYISFDPTKGQYAGILEMSLVDTIGITVIGVLDTIMPDGSGGYSFILIITFTLPPIQLGFGFTLNGVGGLGGVNRTMDTNALQAGFRAHTLDSIMFPADPIANSAQIISNLRSFFPVAVGRYLFGPLLQFGWGEPTLITFTLGVILSVPDPIVIAILGLIDAGLPTEDEALIELHIEVLGIINFGTKTLSIDGSLYDSNVLIYALAGDLALRLSWGSNPNFLYSLGGFNPNFNTNGLDIPQMARLSVSIGDGDNPRISSDSYFAVTSNTVQFGADVQAYASAGGFTIQGYLGFDVLIVISPFSFEFDFTASFDVSYDGANLLGLNVDGLIQGPTPWHFHGDASISILFFTVSASVDLTWGNSTQATIPSQPVLPDLETAFQNPQSWSAALPPATTVGVSLATPSPNNKILCVHPMGTLQVKEKVVPLDLPITKYGNATPSDGAEFSIQSVQINGQTETIQTIQDYFAPGQFLTLSDADKLSNPSFEQYDAGVNIGSSAILNGQSSPRTVVYEEYYIYDPSDFSVFSRLYAMPANIHLALSAQGAGFTSRVKNTGLQKYSTGVTSPAINVAEPQYLVTSVDDLSVRADIVPGGGTTYFEAKAALSTYLSANPKDTGNLQIMPAHEVTA
jgi:hypothetical protein